jgi:hypothetical protein
LSVMVKTTQNRRVCVKPGMGSNRRQAGLGGNLVLAAGVSVSAGR